MSGATDPFGQSSNSPFASQSVFGQTNNAGSNPFAPKPSFGSPTPFGSQTGASASIFGGTSNGVFGAAQSSSPFSSTTAFGASSSPAFGSSLLSFGGSSVFGQKPTSVFSSTATQSSPFTSTTQQSQPAFSSAPSAFCATSTPAFGATSTPAFGATSTPAFGSKSTTSFGDMSTPAFGSTGSPAFGSSATAFGVFNAPIFGTGGTFGASGTPAFGGSSTPAFGASSTPLFSFGSRPSPAFVQLMPSFGSSPFGTTKFGAQSSPFGTQSSALAFVGTSFGQSPFVGQLRGSRAAPYTPTTEADSGCGAQPAAKLESISAMPVYKDKSHEELKWEDYQLGNKGTQSSTLAFGSTTFGLSPFGGQHGGSRVVPYTPTTEADSGSSEQPAAKLESISAMPVYKDKSHEELRWEDYQLGDKGGPQPGARPSGGIGFGVSTAPTSPFGSSLTFGQTSANPFSSTSTNPFSLKPLSFNSTGFTTSTTTSNPFQSTSPSLFGPTSSTTSVFSSSATPTFGTGSSLFSSSFTLSFSSLPSIFGTGAAPVTTPAFATGIKFSSSQTSPLFNSTPAIGQVTSTFEQNTGNFGQTSIFDTPTGFSGNIFLSSLSMAPSSTITTSPLFNSTPAFGQTGNAFGQVTSTFEQNTGNFGQTSIFDTPTGFSGNIFLSSLSMAPSGTITMEEQNSEAGHMTEIRGDVPAAGTSLGGSLICGDATCGFSDAQSSSKDAKERAVSMQKLLMAVVLCIVFMGVEVVGGIKANSLAILTDAAHLLSDVAAFAISLFSLRALGWEATPRQSYGFFRIELLGALVSIQMIWLLVGILVCEAIARLIHDTGEVQGFLMFVVSAFGLVVNIAMAFLLGHDHGHHHGRDHNHVYGRNDHDHHDHSHSRDSKPDNHGPSITSHNHHHYHRGSNSKLDDENHHTHEADHAEPLLKTYSHCERKPESGAPQKKERNINVPRAYLHVLGDSIQSVGVMIGGAIIWYKPAWKIIDPICTLVSSVIVLGATIRMLPNILGSYNGEQTPRN